MEQLFTQLYAQLCRYAFTVLKNSADSEDVVQGVFLHLIEKQQTIDIRVSAKSYLYKMVHHAALNHLRKEATEKRYQLQSANTDDVVQADVFAEESQHEIRTRIDSVLDQLTPQCRIVFVKSRAGNMKYSEIADALGISVKTVEAHMSKALKIVRSALRVFLLFVYLTTMCSPLNCAAFGI